MTDNTIPASLDQNPHLLDDLAVDLRRAEQQRQKGDMLQASAIIENLITQLQSDAPYNDLVKWICAQHSARDAARSLSAIPQWQRDMLRLHAQACALYATVYSDQDRLTDAEQQIIQSQRLFFVINEDQDGRSRAFLADIYRKQGKYTSAIKEFKGNLRLLKQRDDKNMLAFSYSNLAHALSTTGQLRMARLYRLSAIEIAEQMIEPHAAAIFRGDLAKDHYRIGDIKKAEDTAHQALVVLQDIDPRCASYAERVLGDIYQAQDKIDEARLAYSRAANITLSHCHVMAQVGLGWLELRHGSPVEAARVLAVAKDPAFPQEDAALITEASAGLALAIWRQGAHHEAENIIQDSLREEICQTNMQVKGFVWAVHSALLSAQKCEEKSNYAASISDRAFQSSVRPLVGLSAKLRPSNVEMPLSL